MQPRGCKERRAAGGRQRLGAANDGYRHGERGGGREKEGAARRKEGTARRVRGVEWGEGPGGSVAGLARAFCVSHATAAWAGVQTRGVKIALLHHVHRVVGPLGVVVAPPWSLLLAGAPRGEGGSPHRVQFVRRIAGGRRRTAHATLRTPWYGTRLLNKSKLAARSNAFSPKRNTALLLRPRGSPGGRGEHWGGVGAPLSGTLPILLSFIINAGRAQKSEQSILSSYLGLLARARRPAYCRAVPFFFLAARAAVWIASSGCARAGGWGSP
jgi:hypothetical protein